MANQKHVKSTSTQNASQSPNKKASKAASDPQKQAPQKTKPVTATNLSAGKENEEGRPQRTRTRTVDRWAKEGAIIAGVPKIQKEPPMPDDEPRNDAAPPLKKRKKAPKTIIPDNESPLSTQPKPIMVAPGNSSAHSKSHVNLGTPVGPGPRAPVSWAPPVMFQKDRGGTQPLREEQSHGQTRAQDGPDEPEETDEHNRPSRTQNKRKFVVDDSDEESQSGDALADGDKNYPVEHTNQLGEDDHQQDDYQNDENHQNNNDNDNDQDDQDDQDFYQNYDDSPEDDGDDYQDEFHDDDEDDEYENDPRAVDGHQDKDNGPDEFYPSAHMEVDDSLNGDHGGDDSHDGYQPQDQVAHQERRRHSSDKEENGGRQRYDRPAVPPSRTNSGPFGNIPTVVAPSRAPDKPERGGHYLDARREDLYKLGSQERERVKKNAQTCHEAPGQSAPRHGNGHASAQKEGKGEGPNQQRTQLPRQSGGQGQTSNVSRARQDGRPELESDQRNAGNLPPAEKTSALEFRVTLKFRALPILVEGTEHHQVSANAGNAGVVHRNSGGVAQNSDRQDRETQRSGTEHPDLDVNSLRRKQQEREAYDVVAKHHAKNKPTRLPSVQKLDQCRKQQNPVEADAEVDGESEEEEEEEEEEEDDLPKKKEIGRDLRPTKQGYYPSPWPKVFAKTRGFMYQHMLDLELFPGREDFDFNVAQFLSESIVYFVEDCELSLDFDYYEDHRKDMIKMASTIRSFRSLLKEFQLLGFISTFRGRCMEQAREVVKQRYLHIIYPKDDEFPEAFNQQEYHDKVIENVTTLLDRAFFLKDGKDDEGSTNNFMTPALGDLAERLLSMGKKTALCKAFPNIFDNYSTNFMAACACLLRAGLDEYRTGEPVDQRFTEEVNRPFYEKAVYLIQEIILNKKHYKKTTDRWNRWAQEARGKRKREAPKAMAPDDAMDIDLD
ncbi:hypothetical protein C8R45DRAFT_1137894 [Mycena sanguinolenta]|nr:hypothetical protein C8R45DRAFT_1137894 [Mycena sanguinolenta]